MLRFIYSLTAWLCTHYDDMPEPFKKKFPFSFLRDSTLILSSVYENDKLFVDYGKETVD